MKILITGAGGDISQSLCQALKDVGIAEKIIGTDLHNDHVGQFIFDVLYVLPRCDDQNYYAALKEIVSKEGITCIIPGSEPELKQFQALGLFETDEEVKVIRANNGALKVGFDKFKTTTFLKECGLPYPETILVEDLNDLNEKMVLKPRAGSGSKDIFITADRAVLEYVKMQFEGFIAQEFVDAADEEYTCGLYRSSTCEARSIIMKRKLMPGGVTGVGEVISDKSIEKVLSKVAEGLDLQGAINVQLRMRAGEPVIFEINPRFSSTVLFRHHLGFRDLIWSLQDAFGEPIDTYKEPRYGTKFYRGYKEYYRN